MSLEIILKLIIKIVVVKILETFDIFIDQDFLEIELAYIFWVGGFFIAGEKAN